MFSFKRKYKSGGQKRYMSKRANYLFYSLSEGAGKTSLALSFTYFLKNKFSEFFSYIEVPNVHKDFSSMPFQKLAFSLRFKGREYNSFFDGNFNFSEFNIEDGINFVLTKNKSALNYDLAKLKNYIVSAGLSNLVFDIDPFIFKRAGEGQSDFDFFSNIPGKHIVVIDCLPSKLEGVSEKLDLIREKILEGKDFIFLINKFNNFVPEKELLKYLGIKDAYFLKDLPSKDICRSEYNGIPLIENKNLKEEMEKICEKIFAE